MAKRTFTLRVGLGGQISNKIVWDARDTAGESIVRMMADDLIGYAQIKADECDCTFDVSIDDGNHELLFMGKPHSDRLQVKLDGEDTDKFYGYDRFRTVAEFIGYEM